MYWYLFLFPCKQIEKLFDCSFCWASTVSLHGAQHLRNVAYMSKIMVIYRKNTFLNSLLYLISKEYIPSRETSNPTNAYSISAIYQTLLMKVTYNLIFLTSLASVLHWSAKAQPFIKSINAFFAAPSSNLHSTIDESTYRNVSNQSISL